MQRSILLSRHLSYWMHPQRDSVESLEVSRRRRWQRSSEAVTVTCEVDASLLLWPHRGVLLEGRPMAVLTARASSVPVFSWPWTPTPSMLLSRLFRKEEVVPSSHPYMVVSPETLVGHNSTWWDPLKVTVPVGGGF